MKILDNNSFPNLTQGSNRGEKFATIYISLERYWESIHNVNFVKEIYFSYLVPWLLMFCAGHFLSSWTSFALLVAGKATILMESGLYNM